MIRKIISTLLLFTSMFIFSANIVFAETDKEGEFARLADMIIVGMISEADFLEMNLSEDEAIAIFRNIRNQRGWQIDDEELTKVIKHKTKSGAADLYALSVSCSQRIERESGSAEYVTPYWIDKPNGYECGTDMNDVVLAYYTYWGSRVNPDNVRWSSWLWWVQWVVGRCYDSKGGLSANGLCTAYTRVCVGSCAKWLNGDLYYLYLWHK